MFFRKSTKKEPLSDLELIAKYKATEDSTFVGTLYERYSLQIFAICRKYMNDEEEAQDMAMQVFEYLLKELLKYEIQNFKSWLARATKNYCLMRLRKEKRQMARFEDFKNSQESLMESVDFMHPDEEQEREMQVIALREALEGLKDHQRTCVEMFYLQDSSYEEIAAHTGFSMNEVKSYIQNGKRNLKIKLEKPNE
ncbi:MAG: sigma-70 family RNA polymerase sigma factor [Bacteroidia bacterium]|nr:sigma-70 family RNA polymerase sigma factor [Bacteroidia bacterium]